MNINNECFDFESELINFCLKIKELNIKSWKNKIILNLYQNKMNYTKDQIKNSKVKSFIDLFKNEKSTKNNELTRKKKILVQIVKNLFINNLSVQNFVKNVI
jgi:hypothetical protein